MKEKDDDSNGGQWISVSSPDDLHKLVGDGFDINEFNKGLKSFQILTSRPLPVIDYDFDDCSDSEFEFE